MQVATFNLVEKGKLPEIAKKAEVKKGWLGGIKDEYWEYLNRNSWEIESPKLNAAYLAVLLPLLAEKGADLMNSDMEEYSKKIFKERKATTFIFTHLHKPLVQKIKDLNLNEDELRQYFEKFNEVSDPDSGKALLLWTKAICAAVENIYESKALLLQIG